jgi:hypothetical protein
MKRFLLSAFGAAFLFLVLGTVQPANAQVWGDFDNVIKIIPNSPYQSLTNGTVVPGDAFKDPANSAIVDRNDGYYHLNFSQFSSNFQFEFNGEIFRELWICVNGFITFSEPPNYKAYNPSRLFAANNDKPWNIVAPFWGDHYYRISSETGFTPSSIIWKWDEANGVLTIEWKNLNINHVVRNEDGDIIGTHNSSYANFQVKLFRSEFTYSSQGKIQFAYGQTSGNEVNFLNCAIGIRGESGDFMNGLVYENNPYYLNTAAVKVSTIVSDRWQPSLGSDKIIQFNPIVRIYVYDPNDTYWSWGDGDADLSQGYGNKHYQMPKNRFVTVNDALMIMRASATKTPLDPVWRRNAYHGDVNHNGRYYIDENSVKVLIPYRDILYTDNIQKPAWGINAPSSKAIRFETTEYDAALILHYMGGRLLDLPWLLDTIPAYGRISSDSRATGLQFGNPVMIEKGVYQVPVYVNGYLNDAIGARFDVDGQISDQYSSNENMIFLNNGNSLSLAGYGEFAPSAPVCKIVVATENNVLNISGIRFNDKELGDVSLRLGNSELPIEVTAYAYPNPLIGSTTFSVNIEEEADYSLEVFDMFGNLVKTVFNGSLSTGTHDFKWDGSSNSGVKLASGMYFFKLTGGNVSYTNQIVIAE